MSLKSTLLGAAAKVGFDFVKRDGLYICRPVVNGKRWHDWAMKAGVPNPVPADRMHVTIVYSRTDVKCSPQTNIVEIESNRGVIKNLGMDGAALVFAWHDCWLSDRHYWLREQGATSDFSAFRLHVTLSYDAAGFEFPDNLLAEMPELLVLGPEVHSPLNEDAVADLKKEAPAAVYTPDAEDKAAAAAMYADAIEKGFGTPMERAVIYDLSKGWPVDQAEIDALKVAPWAVQSFQEFEKGDHQPEATDQDAEVRKKAGELVASAVLDPSISQASVEVLAQLAAGEEVSVLKIASLPEELMDKLAGFTRQPREILKAGSFQVDDEEQRIAWGWMSVSHLNGQIVTDLHKHEITTKALYQLTHGLIKGQRAGDFDHSRDWCNEIVEAMVFCKARQESLGIDLGMEGALIAMHIPDDKSWDLVKSGEWMFSIDARGILASIEE